MTDLAQKIKKPRIKLQINDGYRFVNDIVNNHGLNTVCVSIFLSVISSINNG